MVFPELSLTGYEPELAKELSFTHEDSRLQPLIDMAIDKNISIGAGAPLKGENLPKIGLLFISAAGTVESYAKMNLHPGEDKFFDKGEHFHHVNLGGYLVDNAICADTNNEKHAEHYFGLGAAIYVAGVLITKGGYQADTEVMKNYAKKFDLLVAMANHNRPTGGWAAAGKSAIWSKDGLLATANETQSAIVVAEQCATGWSGCVIAI
ncbi:carbon-nitrogen hydrolase family protein [Planctobacterium marinum]|uniref:carbon-nitrogen hydrolase family protein n=1 Tax=Planctobacterium marinum TaxID=1631968 RepID=UPI003621209B|nr:carbon-nitrogen hydrolase family protein [Planctobacterium marinum]